MTEFVFTSRLLDDVETDSLFDWLFEHGDSIQRVEEQTLREIKRIIPMWENYQLFHGRWTVSFTDLELAVFFKLKWG